LIGPVAAGSILMVFNKVSIEVTVVPLAKPEGAVTVMPIDMFVKVDTFIVVSFKDTAEVTVETILVLVPLTNV
jgi:hypothetical protein